ncbi:MAG: TatD family hydrolase [Cyclobacteriaceae bacterium]
MKVIETHAHIYSRKFDQDRKSVIERSIEKGVMKIFMPNIDLDSIAPMLQLEEEYPSLCYPMIGLHPCDVDLDFEKKLYEMEAWLNKHQFYGIGETGTDLYWDKTYFEQQKESLKTHIQWAKEKKLPLILHCRESLGPTIELLQGYVDKELTGIFHCFSGTLEQASAIIEMGFFLGIGGTVTYKNSGVGAVLENIGLENLVLETDSPYLAPVPFRGKRNSPEFLPLIAEKIAAFTGNSAEEVAEITNQNAMKIFKQPLHEL